jgi:hypothetical protein
MGKASEESMIEAERVDRRRFLWRAAVSGALPLLTGSCSSVRGPLRQEPIRLRGVVRGGSRPIAGVSVSDGLRVARTDACGCFDFESDASRRFVAVTVPAGFRIPTRAGGVASHYRRIAPDDRGEFSARFDLEPLPASDERHSFVVLADPQTEDRYEVGRFLSETAPDVRATVLSLGDGEVFGVGCGDLMYDDLSLFPEWERAVAGSGIPFFQVIGNHDFDSGGLLARPSPRTFEALYGPTHYSFERGRIHYVVLNDVQWSGGGYRGYVDGTQLEWMRRDLAFVEPGRTVVVFLHIPALDTRHERDGFASPSRGEHVENREELLRLLEPYRAHLVSGHTHEQERLRLGNVTQHVLGTACGAWWSGPICFDGTPNGYSVFEARGDELRWRHKATGLPPEHRFRAYPRGADPRHPGEIVANVWEAGPGWTVLYRENGIRRGPMARRPGTDLLSEELYRGLGRPSRRLSVDPVRTSHLFHARPDPSARRIEIEAIDPWGGSHVAEI